MKDQDIGLHGVELEIENGKISATEGEKIVY